MTNHFLKLTVVTPSRSIFGSTYLNPRNYSIGDWNGNAGTLTLTVSDNEKILANEEIHFTFEVALKNNVNIVGVSPKVSLVSGDGKYEVIPQKTDKANIFIKYSQTRNFSVAQLKTLGEVNDATVALLSTAL